MSFDGLAFYAPIPTCPVHGGDLRLNFAMDRWECAGWDGEGCPIAVASDDLEWTDLGPAHLTEPMIGPRDAGDLPLSNLDLCTGTSTVTVPFNENARWALGASCGG